MLGVGLQFPHMNALMGSHAASRFQSFFILIDKTKASCIAFAREFTFAFDQIRAKSSINRVEPQSMHLHGETGARPPILHDLLYVYYFIVRINKKSFHNASKVVFKFSTRCISDKVHTFSQNKFHYID